MHMDLQLRRILVVAAVCLLAVCVAPAQTLFSSIGQDGPFQIRYASNVSAANDTVINFTDSGASWGQVVSSPGAATTITNTTGNICVNVYVFTPDEQLQECCAVAITPNALWSASVFTDLTASPAYHPLSMANVVIKMVASSTNTNAGCDAGTSGLGSMPAFPVYSAPVLSSGGIVPTQTPSVSYIVEGLDAWARGNGTETPFSNSNLSAAELAHITSLCAFIELNASGAGKCALHVGGK